MKKANARFCPLRGMALLLATLLMGSATTQVLAQATREECYAAQEGQRRSSRRRPGAEQPVDCKTLPAAVVPVESMEVQTEEPVAADSGARRRPGGRASIAEQEQQSLARGRSNVEESPVPRPQLADYGTKVPVPDRWRIVEAIGYTDNWYDPYNRNTLKADVPIHDDWFFSVGVISDTVFEDRKVVTPVGLQSTHGPRSLDLYGDDAQQAFVENLLMEFVYYKGDTVFRPPDYEFRFIPVLNYNRAELQEIQGVNADPGDGRTRNDHHLGIQGAFLDVHLRNVSDNYDFDSVRVGIQPFNADFRGFLFQDSQLGVRLFGTRNNNILQYNLAWFRRLEKDTNSGLNDVTEDLRDDDVFTANLYWQDLLALGHNSQFSLTWNHNREDEFFYNTNDFIERPASLGFERPRDYDVVYAGFSGDGHFGRLNLTHSLYAAFGEQEDGPFAKDKTDIQAFFAAAEASMDFDWIRVRGSALWATGDDDPFDDEENGFDAIFENPQFAGADTSYWIRQAVPLAGGGKVALSSRNGILNSMRSSKEHGQSNFTNPGIRLLGVGADLDLLPELRLSANVNQLWFDQTEVLEVARQQSGVGRSIGTDISLSAIYRPFMSQNVVVRLSYAALIPGSGFKDLYEDDTPHSLLFNLVLTY